MGEPYEREVIRHERQVGDPVQSDTESEAEHVTHTAVTIRPGYAYRAVKVVWFVVSVVVALATIRFVLKLLGASSQADFVRLIYGVTDPLVAPFQGIFKTQASGGFILEPESLVAITVYLLLGWAVATLVRLATSRGTHTPIA